MTKNYLLTFTCITLSGKVAKLIKYMIRYDATAESTQIHKHKTYQKNHTHTYPRICYICFLYAEMRSYLYTT